MPLSARQALARARMLLGKNATAEKGRNRCEEVYGPGRGNHTCTHYGHPPFCPGGFYSYSIGEISEGPIPFHHIVASGISWEDALEKVEYWLNQCAFCRKDIRKGHAPGCRFAEKPKRKGEK